MILTKTTHICYFTANTWYNSAKTDIIHEGGCLVDEKLSLSRVKIVGWAINSMLPTTHKLFFLIIICSIAITYNDMFYNVWLYECSSIV